MKKVLITGVAGFIGSHLAEYFLDRNFKVVGIDNMSTGNSSNLDAIYVLPKSKNFEFIKMDILEDKKLIEVTKDISYILHHAAMASVSESFNDNQGCNRINITGTTNILQAANLNNVERVVLASSAAVYGNTDNLPISESDKCTPLSPYAVSKLTGEMYLNIFFQHFNLKTIILRYFNVYGERQSPHSAYAAVVPKFIEAVQNNENFEIHGNGMQTRDFIHVKTVAEANFNACVLEDLEFGSPYNIASGTGVSVKDLAKTINKLHNGKDSELVYSDSRAGDIKNSVANIDKALKANLISTGLEIEVGLKNTLSKTANNK